MNGTIKAAEFKAASKIDSSGLVHGVSVLTEGEAEGHSIFIDSRSVELARSIATSFAGGVKVKMEHSYGVDRIIGALKNFRVDGKQLRADLQLLREHPAYNFIRELISVQPTTFGLSISFSFSREKINGKDFVRFEDIFSVDIVDRPAANPGGLFSANPIAPTRDTTKLMAAYLAAFGQEQYSAIVNRHGPEAIDRLERGLFYSGLNIPGYDFSNASRHGEAKPPFGFRRIETSERQARIDACLSRLK